MWSYFKPLRRKLGVVTLAIACVFVAVWVWSIKGAPRGTIPTKLDVEFVGSGIQLGVSQRIDVVDQYIRRGDTTEPQYLVRNFVDLTLPYWLIVLLLTLLSAGLLFSNPKSKIMAQPTRKAKMSLVAIVLAGLPLLIYPGVLLASVMGLGGHTSGKEPFVLLLAAYSFHLGAIAYPAVYIPCVVYSIKESSRGEGLRAYWFSITPLIYLTVLACLMALMSLGSTS